MIEASSEPVTPATACWIGSGFMKRWMAAYAMPQAASRINSPSNALARYSALLKP